MWIGVISQEVRGSQPAQRAELVTAVNSDTYDLQSSELPTEILTQALGLGLWKEFWKMYIICMMSDQYVWLKSLSSKEADWVLTQDNEGIANTSVLSSFVTFLISLATSRD